MRITKLILKKYKRFLLNLINELDYSPDSPYQIITGNNGSGKSSLLEELSPLPPDKNKFNKGGYKEIHIEHRGKRYQLINDYTKSTSGVHAFIVDGEDLNESHSVTTQKELAEQHFNYTNEIHQLMLGRTKFTDMAGLQRRDWFVKIANADMDYVMGVFNKVRSAHRDGQGAVKLTEKRLVEETNKLIDEKLLEELTQQQSVLQVDISAIEKILPRVFKSTEQLETELMKLIDSIQQEKAKIIQMDSKGVRKPSHIDSLEVYRLSIEQNNFMLTTLQQEFEELTKEYEVTEKKLQEIEWNSNVSTESLLAERKQLDEQIRQLRFNEHVTDVDKALETLQSIHGEFDAWCAESPVNQEGRFNQENLDQYNKRLTEILDERGRVNVFLAKTQSRIEHIHQHQLDAVCPSCQNKFTVAPNMERLPELETGKLRAEKRLGELDKEKSEVEEWLTEAKRFRDNYLNGRNKFITPYPELRFFFYQLVEETNFKNNPMLAVGKMTLLIEELKETREVVRARKRLDEINVILAKRGETDGEFLKGYLDVLSTRIETNRNKFTQQTQQNKSDDHVYQHVKEVLRLHQNLEWLTNEYESLMTRCLEAIKFEVLEEGRKTLLSQLGVVELQLRESQAQFKIIEGIKDHIRHIKDQEQRLKRLIEVLNPNDGLIAKTLLGFIHHFLNNFNQLIGHIWTYELSVIADEENDFTNKYRFPVNIGNNDTSEDISKTSEGQQEIINFAFKMLVMRYLGLQDFPLLFDELGRTFTEEHRVRLFNYLKLLVESGQVEQIFLVSHIASSHDTFNLADFISMDINGVMKTERVNRVAKFA